MVRVNHLLDARVLLSAIVIVSNARVTGAQASVQVLASSIASGKAAQCWGKSPQLASLPADTTHLKIVFVSDDSARNPVRTQAASVAQLDAVEVATVEAGVDHKDLAIATSTLTNATFMVMREDAKIPLCSIVLVAAPFLSLPQGPSYTSFVADGSVGKVLRGASASDVTGSLGIDHRSVASKRQLETNAKYRPLLRLLRAFLPGASAGEELHAMLTVAGSADSLTGEPAKFGAAVLLPSLSGNGSLQAATIDYHFFNPLNAAGGTWGPRGRLTFARTLWRVIDATAKPKPDTLHQSIPLTALDLGLRFTFINHLEDAKQNIFAFGIDPSYVWRYITPNSTDDSRAVRLALRNDTTSLSPPNVLHGPSIAFWIKLRQVTATADLIYLSKPRFGPIEGLTGLQPVVTMQYSSPLFTF